MCGHQLPVFADDYVRSAAGRHSAAPSRATLGKLYFLSAEGRMLSWLG